MKFDWTRENGKRSLYTDEKFEPKTRNYVFFLCADFKILISVADDVQAGIIRNDFHFLWIYEGESISNQAIPFPMDRDGHDFHALFQYMFHTCVENCTLIDVEVKHG